MAKAVKINTDLLKAIAAGTVSYVTKPEAEPLIAKGLIEVNATMLDPTDSTKAAVRLTDAGKAAIPAAGASEAAPAKSPYEVITNAVLPEVKRGNKGGGAPMQYPFDSLAVGASFFVPVSEKHPNPAKSLGSTVSSANARYAEETGESKTVSRTKRGAGNKAVKDAAGNNVKEEVTVKVKKPTRKFRITAVEAGKQYGEWTAPANGALIGRVM